MSSINYSRIFHLMDLVRKHGNKLNNLDILIESKLLYITDLELDDPEIWKDHNTRELINNLTTIAVHFRGMQQLRERIAHEIIPLCTRLKELEKQIGELK